MSKRYEKIAFVKTAWSADYNGSRVKGNHKYLRGGHDGHEKFNFKLTNGAYYACIPPIGRNHSPKPTEKEGWLLIFISAKDGTGPLQAVGWHENAIFEDGWSPRPEYKSNPRFEKDDTGEQYSYCVWSDRAHPISVARRPAIPIGKRMKRTPILYARGNKPQETWRESLARRAELVVKQYRHSKPKRK